MSCQVQFSLNLYDLADVCEGDTHYDQLAVFDLLYWLTYAVIRRGLARARFTAPARGGEAAALH